MLRLALALIPTLAGTCTGGEVDPPGDGSYSGRVLDAITGIGIFQIEVTCLDVDGTPATEPTRTGGSGELSFAAGSGCIHLRAADVDGPANGSYTSATVDAGQTVIELDPL
jgi:hypothetical protein